MATAQNLPPLLWSWQLETFASYHEAAAASQNLQAQGWPSYVQLLPNAGAALLLGCFVDEASADVFAQMNTLVSEHAQRVALPADAPLGVCLRYQLGFRLPDRWGILNDEGGSISFWVELAGKRSFFSYDRATHWRIFQDVYAFSARSQERLPRSAASLFSQDDAQQVYAQARWHSRYRLADGTLLWQEDDSAVIRGARYMLAVQLFVR